MKELILNLDKKYNELTIVNSKLQFADSEDLSKIEDEKINLESEINLLKLEAEKVTKIDDRKSLIFEQLSEYIKSIDTNHQYSFSKGQGLSFPAFYIHPLMNIRQIIFYDQNGLHGVINYLTVDEKDSVKNKEEFLDFLKNKKTEILKKENLYDLYEFYKEFHNIITRDFC